jgi:hypothetical protein
MALTKISATTSSITSTDLSLGNVTNESKATMFTSPTFTGTVSGISQSMITGNSGFTNMVTYTSGSGNWTVPAGVTRFKVMVLGGGGGGASSFMTVPAVGGGSGGCAIKIFNSVVPGTVCAYVVGTGGTAGAFSNPGTGGNGVASTFTYSGTTLTGNGGNGGLSYNGSVAVYVGVTGGTATGGDLNIAGGYSQSVFNNNTSAAGGHGGSSPLGLGFGGRGGITTGFGPTGGTGYGAGAGGAGNGDTAARTGVAGQGGIIIIEY